MSRQQLWLIPTMSFWLRGDVRHFLVPTYLAGLSVAMVAASTLGLSALSAGMLGAALPLLGVGLLERAVRKATARRRLIALPAARNG